MRMNYGFILSVENIIYALSLKLPWLIPYHDITTADCIVFLFIPNKKNEVLVDKNICTQINISCLCVFIVDLLWIGAYLAPNTVWQLRRYLPSTVLSRWRTRLSVSVQFSSIQATSRERGIDWVCTGVKKCVETFWNTGRVVGNPHKAVRGVCRSALKRTVMRIWREGTCSSKYKPEIGTCWMRKVLAVIWNWLKCEWSQLFFHSCLKYHQSISSEK